MSPRDMTREQLEDALRAAQGEAEQYRREALAWRWLEAHRFTAYTATDPEDGHRMGYTVLVNEKLRSRSGITRPTLLHCVEAAMLDPETASVISPVVEEQSK